MRKSQSGDKRLNGLIFLASLKQMESIQNVQAPERQGLTHILHRRVITKPVVKTPITMRDLRSASHDFEGESVLLKKVAVTRIVIRRGAVEDRIQFFHFLAGNTGILYLGERRPVTQSRVCAELGILLRRRSNNHKQHNQHSAKNPVGGFHSLIFSLLSTAIALCLPFLKGVFCELNASKSIPALTVGA